MKENKQKKATKLHNTYRIKKWERKQYIKKCESNTIKDVMKIRLHYKAQNATTKVMNQIRHNMISNLQNRRHLALYVYIYIYIYIYIYMTRMK